MEKAYFQSKVMEQSRSSLLILGLDHFILVLNNLHLLYWVELLFKP